MGDFSHPARAQEPLAITWSATDRWLQADGRRESAASDAGALRGRFTQGACRSNVTAGNDLPVVVRFDSTQTTLMGRGAAIVNAVASFPGSAWDVSDPAAPRRLNLLLRESAAGVPDTSWTPGATGEHLFVMTSSYDGAGTSYAGRNLALNLLDCLYALTLVTRPSAGSAPFEMDVRPAQVWPLSAYRPYAPANAGTDLAWTYDGSTGAAVRVRRVARGQEAERTVATLPASTRSFTDSGTASDTLYHYRIEVVDGEGRRLAASPLSRLVRRSGVEGLTLRGTLNVGRGAHDVWGYVGPDGREYALLNAQGLTVIDVTNPDAPAQIAYVPGGNSDIEAYGHHVYVTGDNSAVQVIDLTNPAAPVLVRQFWGHPDDPTRGVHTLSIVGDRMYLNGNVPGFTIWSLANPAEPSYLGAYRGGYTHDLLVRGDTAYAALIYGGGIHVVDVSNPTQPTLMTSFNYPGSGAHNVCSSADGRYLFVGDEIGTGRWTRVFDVSDLDNVELVAQIIVDPAAVVHNCHRVGDRLFIAHYTEGVRVWNIADPTQPVEVAFYNDPLLGVSDTSPYSGIWTVWPHLPSGTLLASNYDVADGSPGLLLFTLDGGVDGEPEPLASTALAFRLAPNPTVGGTTALITLAAPTEVALTVHDILGRSVATLDPARLPAGAHRLDVPVKGLPAGVYVVRLTAGGRAAGTQTLTILR